MSKKVIFPAKVFNRCIQDEVDKVNSPYIIRPVVLPEFQYGQYLIAMNIDYDIPQIVIIPAKQMYNTLYEKVGMTHKQIERNEQIKQNPGMYDVENMIFSNNQGMIPVLIKDSKNPYAKPQKRMVNAWDLFMENEKIYQRAMIEGYVVDIMNSNIPYKQPTKTDERNVVKRSKSLWKINH